MPLTVAVPTMVPPLVQVVGAVACGPKTVNVIVPPASVVAPDSAAPIDVPRIGVPVASLAGPLAVRLVGFETVTVFVKPVVAVQPA